LEGKKKDKQRRKRESFTQKGRVVPWESKIREKKKGGKGKPRPSAAVEECAFKKGGERFVP